MLTQHYLSFLKLFWGENFVISIALTSVWFCFVLFWVFLDSIFSKICCTRQQGSWVLKGSTSAHFYLRRWASSHNPSVKVPKVWKWWGPNWEISWLRHYSRIRWTHNLVPIWHAIIKTQPYLHVPSLIYDIGGLFTPSYSLANKLCLSFVGKCMIHGILFLR